jgi:RNA polymerase sigma factor (sigma-70 family)
MTPWAVINPARLAGSGLLRTQSDSRLVDLVRAGNDRAFEAIVLRYHRPLLRHCRRLLPAGRAEDAVQQALLRALEAMRADDRELQLGPWLHRIAHNTAIDSLRRMDSHWEELDERMDGVEPTHAAAERRARFASVMTNMGELPERQRRALVLRELEGRSYDEIAATLGVTGDGVRQLLNRARNSMRAAASALVPPALVGRIAGSQASVRIAELMDPPSSALMAKATAAVAAGAVALFAVTGPPTGDGGKVPRAEAAEQTPAPAQRGGDSDGRPGEPAGSADPGSGSGEQDDAGPRGDGRENGKAGGQKGAGRAAAGAGPGGGSGSGGGDDDGPAQRAKAAPPAGGDDDDDDDDAPATRRSGGDDDDDDAPAARGRGGGDDDDDGAPAASPGGGSGGGDDDDGPAASAPAGGNGGDDGGDEGAVAAAPAPPPDDGGDDEGAAAPAAPPNPAPPPPQPQSTLADDDGGEADD